MKILQGVVVGILVLLCSVVVSGRDIEMRALIAEGAAISFQSSTGFVLYKENRGNGVRFDEPEMLITIDSSGVLQINGKRTTVSAVTILPYQSGFCTVGTNRYSGRFFCTIHDGKLVCINHVPLEEYVYSVVRWESWPGWPIEVNRAFAITCRTYAIAARDRARKRGALYDLRNTNAHQTYKGLHESDHLQEAVESTRGIIMLHDNRPIVAMYDSCCGGLIPSKMAHGDVKKHAYLARSYPCTYCSGCKLYSWEVSYSHQEFSKIVTDSAQSINAVETECDPAGIVHRVRFKQGSGKGGSWISYAGSELYSLCKEIKSFCFTIVKNGRNFIVRGRGFGHHLGLCQWGAREMVRLGKGWREILNFYYPEIKFGRILLKDS